MNGQINPLNPRPQFADRATFCREWQDSRIEKLGRGTFYRIKTDSIVGCGTARSSA
jgi:hypothetical protein